MRVYKPFLVGIYMGLCALAVYQGLQQSLFSAGDARMARQLSHSSVVKDFLFLPSSTRLQEDSIPAIAVRKNEDNDIEFKEEKLVLAMIAFGNATKGTHVQRVIRSARTRGEWHGRIVIITDSKHAYRDVTKEDPLVSVLHPQREDWQELPEFKEDKMKIKRFKTLLLDYIFREPELIDTEFVLYVDIDIILGQPLVPWLREKWQKGANNRMAAIRDGMSTMYMFNEGYKKGPTAGHSGLILLQKDLSDGCLRKWREIFDRYRERAPRDQWLIRKMRKASDRRTKCRISAWSPRPNDILFPKPSDLTKRTFPQFMHLTNTYRAQWIDADLQKAWLEDALRLTDEEKKDPASLAVVPENF